MRSLNFSIKLFLLLNLFFTSCSPLESVVFRRINNTEIVDISNGEITIQADVEFFNPNKIKGKIREVAIDVVVRDEKVAHLEEESRVKVGKQEYFTVPVKLTIKMKPVKNDLLGNLVKIIKTRKITLNYSGYIRIKTYGVGRNIPIKYQEDIELKM